MPIVKPSGFEVTNLVKPIAHPPPGTFSTTSVALGKYFAPLFTIARTVKSLEPPAPNGTIMFTLPPLGDHAPEESVYAASELP